MDQDIRISYQASHDNLYQSLLNEFEPKNQGIFSGDRIQGTGVKHYSNVAICIRSLLPLSLMGIPTLDHSLLGLLSLYYGNLHGDSGLEELAYSSYTAALGQYSRLLSRFLHKDTEIPVQACQAFIYISISMQIFEYLRGAATQGTEKQPHIGGVLEALRCCGPQALGRSSGLQMAFRGVRGVAIFDAIEQRKKSFLAEPDWLSVPQRLNKSMRDRLNDIGVHIPGLLECSDLLFAAQNAQVSQHLESAMSLLARITLLRHELHGWLSIFQSTTTEPLYWSRSTPITQSAASHDTECVPKYSNHFHQNSFPSGPVAGLLVQYWSFSLQLSMAAIELQLNLLSHDDQVAQGVFDRETLHHDVEKDQILADKTAQLILEAEPFLSSCFEGLVCLQSPLRIVGSFFNNPSPSSVIS